VGIIDVVVVDVVTELIEVLLVETLVETTLTVPEPELVTLRDVLLYIVRSVLLTLSSTPPQQ
jgi:hypothetical protein